MTNWGKEISEAVKARGYVQGTMTQSMYALSQYAKIVEELYELLQCFKLDSAISVELLHGMSLAENSASHMFNKEERLGNPFVNVKLAASELADIQVVVMMLAECLGVDVLEEAKRKAKGDVRRGVRPISENAK